MNSDVLNPLPAHGQPLFTAILKAQSADFRVDEVLDIDFSGNGEHLYLQIEKTAMNTDELVSLLQEGYEVNSADIGLCGLKDRHSVSTQWFSVRTPADSLAFEELALRFNARQKEQWGEADPFLKSLRLVGSQRHSRKLKRGAHECNRFVVTLRDLQPMPDELLRAEVAKRIHRIDQKGFPAYIGAQRFGKGGQNLQRARQWFAKKGKRTSRQQRSLWLSAARSALFNNVCAARVRDGTWDQLLDGEPAVLNGTSSFFIADLADSLTTLTQRIESFDIHPSAPWWGRGRTPAQDVCADIEARLLEPFADICAGLERAGLSQERRALRAVAQELTHCWLDDDVMELSFSLAPGVFATTLLRELGNCTEPVRA